MPDRLESSGPWGGLDPADTGDAPGLGEPREALGRRIAEHRAKLGWTQQDLADRLAVSRVAVSHLESGSTQPGERTVVLLAGVFKVEPRALVADTTYPQAKADRLPAVAARYTEIELQVALLDNDLGWLEHVPPALAVAALTRWQSRLAALAGPVGDREGADLLAAAVRRVNQALDEVLAAGSRPSYERPVPDPAD